MTFDNSHVNVLFIVNAGVDVSQNSISLTTTEVFHGQSQSVTFDFSSSVNPNYGSVSGNNLWVITAWVSPNSAGTNPLETTQISLTSDQSNLAFESGATSVFSSLEFPLDLTTTPTCSDFNYFCVQLERSSSASVDFTLSGDLTECVPITCTGTSRLSFSDKLVVWIPQILPC